MESIPSVILGLPATFLIIMLVDLVKAKVWDPGRYAGVLAAAIATAIGSAYLLATTSQPPLVDVGEGFAWGLALPVVKSALLAPLADATNAPGQREEADPPRVPPPALRN